MSNMNKTAKILLAATALLIALPPVLAQENPPPFKSPFKTIDGGDDDWFMEETTPKKPKQPRPVKIPDSQANNLGVPMTEDGRIIPLKDDGTPVMPQTSQLEVTNEYIIQPGGYYPGIPQYNVPYMGGLNPYYAPGVVPYGYNNGGININFGKAGGIRLGGNNAYNNPYGYGYGSNYATGFGISPYGYGTNFISPGYNGFNSPGLIPSYGMPGYGNYNGFGGYGVPGIGGVRPGIGGVSLPGIPAFGR